MPKIYSVDNCMKLVFKSDSSNEGKGFEAQYTTENNTVRLDPKNCSADFLAPSHGTLFTPNWPLVYPASASCVWTFNPPPATIVRFFFTSFELIGHRWCEENIDPVDHISINGTNTTGGQVIIKELLCTVERDNAFFPIKDMKAIEVRFETDNVIYSWEGPGVMAGYATYIEGYLDSSRCTTVPPTTVPPSTGTSVTSSTKGSTPTTKSPSGLSGVEIAGIVIAVVLVGGAIIALLVYCICCKKPSPPHEKEFATQDRDTNYGIVRSRYSFQG